MVSKATIVTMAATALAAAAPARAQTAGGVEGFQLPPSAPDIQGPVTPDNPIVERRAPAPKPATPPKVEIPAPKPATPKPATESAAAAEKPAAPKPATPKATDSAKPKPGTQPVAEPAAPATQASEPAASPERTAEPAAPETVLPPAPAPMETPAVTARPVPVIAPAPPATAAVETSDSGWWRYLVVALLLIPMGVAGFLFWRQNRGRREGVFVLPIERPKPRPVTLPEEPASVQDEVVAEEEPVFAGPLRHALESTSLSVSLINATLSYQLTLTNTSGQMIRNVAIFGDLVSAHASLSVEEQLAGPGGTHAPLHLIPALLPGQSTFLNGQLRLPISAIRPLRRDEAVLFVPLARMRIEAEGLEGALVQTCVVGQKPAGPGAGLRPFRLDTGPRIYAEIGQRTLDLPTPQAA
jgi:hypothetical protein